MEENNMHQPIAQPDLFQPTNDLIALRKEPKEPVANPPTPKD